MRIMLTSDSGEVLDSEEITREEWDALSPAGALALLSGLSVGDAL